MNCLIANRKKLIVRSQIKNYGSLQPRPGYLMLIVFLTSFVSCTDSHSSREGWADHSSSKVNESQRESAASPAKTLDKPGHWRELRRPDVESELSEQQQQDFAKLRTLGYVAGSREPVTDQVVAVHQREKVAAGLNFYTSAHAAEAYLMDVDGNEVHRWKYDFKDALQHAPEELRQIATDLIHSDYTDYWRRAFLFENGDILAIFEGILLLKIDKDSNLIWAKANGAHHDVEVMPNGEIYVLTRRPRMIPHINANKPILDEFVCILNSDGTMKRCISLINCVESLLAEKGRKLPEGIEGDILHSNAVEVLQGNAEHLSAAFQKGNVLISMRYPSTVAVIDLETEKFVWHLNMGDHSPPTVPSDTELFFKWQHEPIILPGGNMLLFDNEGIPKQSTIWEFNPMTNEVHWAYQGTDARPFYTRVCGTSQRLPNGNTLITESENGHVFEVTQEKDVVWEFYNPRRAGDKNQFIAMIPEMVRLPADFPVEWAGTHTSGDGTVPAESPR